MTRTNPIFSLVMPYHAAPLMLRRHVFDTASLPPHLYEAVELVVCDDASAEPIRPRDDFLMCRAQFFRIPPPHIRWSHRCATNIAAHHARGEWLLITDIDHNVPRRTWEQLHALHTAHRLDPNTVYFFSRCNTDGAKYKPHPDSWLIRRDMWRKIGGYDTRYRGHYGQNSAFQERVAHHAGNPQLLPYELVRHTREDIADASMPVEFGRKCDRDRQAVATMRQRFRDDGTYYQPGEVIPHERVYP